MGIDTARALYGNALDIFKRGLTENPQDRQAALSDLKTARLLTSDPNLHIAIDELVSEINLPGGEAE